MKIHRVVQMLGATTSTGKLADDMYDLGHKDYYSEEQIQTHPCLLYTSPSPRDGLLSRMPSSA